MRFFTLLILFYFYTQSAFSIPTLSQKIMISGSSKLALKSALRVAKEGGNPVDIAVAYGLTLSVTHPHFGSLGGGGFAMINMNGKPEVLDFRERAPLKTNPDYFVKSEKSSLLGGAAVGVPGFPRGLWDMHQKHGSKPWKSLFKEALEATKKGFPVSSEWYQVTKRKRKNFWSGGAHHFLNDKMQVPLPGDILKQPGLHQALKLLKNKGPKGFYEGAVAKDLVETINQSGGDFGLEDMKNYKTIWRVPLATKFNGYDLFLMPPPSSGGIIIKIALELSKKLNLKSKKPLSVEEFHSLSEIMSLSFRGRTLLGDPDFIKNPIAYLESPKYINSLTKIFRKNQVSKLSPFDEKKFYKSAESAEGAKGAEGAESAESAEGAESAETTHYIVMNKKGQAVSLTVTLNGNYGSGVISKRFGVALNNEMDDFTTVLGKPNLFGLIQGKANQVEAYKRPLSSMSPSLALKNGKTVLALGAPGGPRIINGVFQVLYRTLQTGFNMEQAIFTPRIHHQFLPRVTFYEKDRFSPEVLKGLKKKGHKLKSTYGVAIVYGVRFNKEGLLEGAADYRGEGFVGGL